MANDRQDEINYEAEGATPPREKNDPTNAGYDEAAHRGGAYGVAEGRGGVFGTSGGGTFRGGMHVEDRPAVNEGGEQSGRRSGNRGLTTRTPATYDDDQTEARNIGSRKR